MLFDGSEECVVRKATFSSVVLGHPVDLCFSWQLLYASIDRLVKGDHFYTLWVEAMQAYDRAGWSDQKLAMLQSVYRHFREAMMDGADLMPMLWEDIFTCQCNNPTGSVVIDALTIACQLRRMNFVGPWLPRPAAEGAPPVPAQCGSEYSARFAVPDAAMRSGLRELSHKEGLPADKFEAVLETCRRPEVAQGHIADLLEALAALSRQPDGEDGNVVMLPWVRELLYELGAHTPACALVHHAEDLFEDWLTAVQRVTTADDVTDELRLLWGAEQRARAAKELPALQRPLAEIFRLAVEQPHSWDSTHTETLVGLCDSMLTVRAAYELPIS
jgi:hypothetical protein